MSKRPGTPLRRPSKRSTFYVQRKAFLEMKRAERLAASAILNSDIEEDLKPYLIAMTKKALGTKSFSVRMSTSGVQSVNVEDMPRDPVAPPEEESTEELSDDDKPLVAGDTKENPILVE